MDRIVPLLFSPMKRATLLARAIDHSRFIARGRRALHQGGRGPEPRVASRTGRIPQDNSPVPPYFLTAVSRFNSSKKLNVSTTLSIFVLALVAPAAMANRRPSGWSSKSRLGGLGRVAHTASDHRCGFSARNESPSTV